MFKVAMSSLTVQQTKKLEIHAPSSDRSTLPYLQHFLGTVPQHGEARAAKHEAK